MNYLYIPELHNCAINLDQVISIYVGSKDRKLHYKKLDGTWLWHNIPEDEWNGLDKADNVKAVRDRLDMFFLNKGPTV